MGLVKHHPEVMDLGSPKLRWLMTFKTECNLRTTILQGLVFFWGVAIGYIFGLLILFGLLGTSIQVILTWGKSRMPFKPLR